MQYKLTCGYLPQEGNCHRNGQCAGCEYAEPVKQEFSLNTIIRFMFDRNDLSVALEARNIAVEPVVKLLDEMEDLALLNLLSKHGIIETHFDNEYEYQTDELQFHYEPPELEVCLLEPVKPLECRTLVSMGVPAQIVPSCVCAMSTDCPGFCAQPEFRGWLGGCCPEMCPWKKGHLGEGVKNNGKL